MEPKPLVSAAQYVRMSTEDQQYSIVNQEAAIRTYAMSHGYAVVSSYADAGTRAHRRDSLRSCTISPHQNARGGNNVEFG